jgi:microsomal epoxide hydrolase
MKQRMVHSSTLLILSIRRTCEERINSFPNYKIPVQDNDGKAYDIHFIALFSEKVDAVPVILLHGWPGSFLEFLDILSLMAAQYTPENLPYHLIVPSLPGYAYSASPPLDKDFRIEDVARLMNHLMLNLGFRGGYVAQGGDIGSKVGRVMAAEHEACKAVHSTHVLRQSLR